jgi:hypothetical protein
LRGTLAQAATGFALQPLEHLHALHVARPAAAKGVFGFGIGVCVADYVINKADNAQKTLGFGKRGGGHETHQPGIDLRKCYNFSM